MNEDQRAFRQFAEANGVHYAKQAAQLADYDTGADMHAMLKTVLDVHPYLKTTQAVKHIGGPTDFGTDTADRPPMRQAKHADELSGAAQAAKNAGTIAARAKYAREKRKAGGYYD